MYQNYLIAKDNEWDNKLIHLKYEWVKNINGLPRVPFYNDSEPEYGYVVIYSEKKRSYILEKFSRSTGTTIWEKSLVNGGYGTPVILNNRIFMLSAFDSVIGVSTDNGQTIFEKKFGKRIRTSLNVIDDVVAFAAGNEVIMLDINGDERNKLTLSNVFIYGVVQKYCDLFVITGTKYIKRENTSNKFVWLIDSDGTIVFEIDLGKGSIISADTSGLWVCGRYGFIGNNDIVFKLDLNSGTVVWKRKVVGDCDRETIVTDKKHAYVTTLKGRIYCLDIESGVKRWEKKVTEGLIESPVSIIGNSILVLGDASIYLIDKRDGIIYDKYPVGHTPYSMCSIMQNHVFVGGGEPPVDGALTAFSITGDNSEYIQSFSVNRNFDDKYIDIIIKCSTDFDEGYIKTNRISTLEKMELKRICPNTFTVQLPLKNRNVEGMYALPVFLKGKNGNYQSFVITELERDTSLPQKHTIKSLQSSSVTENSIFNSGAAIAEEVFKKYGKNISQEEFRKIINYVKDKSEWEDADFQTWRLILKRVLTSPAHSLDEFIAMEDNSKDD